MKRLIGFLLLLISGSVQGAALNSVQAITTTQLSATSMRVDWTDTSNALGYRVERCTGNSATCEAAAATYTEVGVTAAGVKTFTDTGLSTGTTYTWRVREDPFMDASATPTTTLGTTSTTTTTIGATTTTTIPSTAGTFQCNTHFGGTAASASAYGWAVATDPSGNIITGGQYSGTVDFGFGAVASGSGSTDAYIVKLNSSCFIQWQKLPTGGGNGTEAVFDVATDSNSNVIAVGQFTGFSTPITITIDGTTLTSSGNSDGFVAKFNSSGTAQWVKKIGGTLNDTAYRVGTDSSGNVYVAGSFNGTVNFGGGNVTSNGGADVFLIKYDTNGVYQWSVTWGGGGNDTIQDIAIDSAGNIDTVTTFTNPIILNGTTYFSAGANDILLAQFTMNGLFSWAQKYGGPNDDVIYSIAADPNGNVLVSGVFSGTVNFGCGSLTETGAGNWLVGKYTSGGTCTWTKSFGSTDTLNAEIGKGVASDGAGNVLTTGYVANSVNFGCGSVFGTSYDPVIVKLDTSGTCVFSKRSTGSSNDQGIGIAAGSGGNVVGVGIYLDSVTWSTPLTSPGGTDTYVVSFSP